MMFFVLMGIVCIPYLRFVGVSEESGFPSIPRALGLCACVLGVMAGSHALKWSAYGLGPYYSIEKRTSSRAMPIYSLGNPQLSTGGSFVLGFGTVKSEVVYFAVVRTPDGGFMIEVIKGNPPVYEEATDAASAALVTQSSYDHCVQLKPVPAWLSVLWPVDCWGIGDEKKKLVVPKGTVKQVFSLP